MDSHRVTAFFPADPDWTIGGILGGLDPGQALGNLGVYPEPAVGRELLQRPDAARSLVEPGAYSVETVVDPASFPFQCSQVVMAPLSIM